MDELRCAVKRFSMLLGLVILTLLLSTRIQHSDSVGNWYYSGPLVARVFEGMIPHDLVLDGRAAMWTDILSNWAGMSARMGSGVGIAPFPEDRAAANPVSLTGYYVSAGTGQPQACWQ